MNIKQIKQENFKAKEIVKVRTVPLLTKAIAKILLKFKMLRSEFIRSLDEQLVQEAKKQDPNASIVSLAIRTGIDRRYIGKYLKGDMPFSKPDKLSIILEDIKWTAHKFYNSNRIPKKGHFRTFQSICELRASGTLTHNAILEELIRNGNLIDLGTKVELVSTKSQMAQDNINYSQITANQISRTVETIIYNLDIDLQEDRYVQRTVYSSQINPIHFKLLHNQLKKKAEDYFVEIDAILGSYEEEVNVGTHPEYGFSLLEYKIEKKS